MSALNLDLTYFEHRKTKRLIGLLGRGSEVLPLKLWAYCGRAHPVDGSLADYTEQEIESLVGWWGQSGRFVSAMVTVGFIDGEAGSYRVHEWEEHQGHIAAFHERAKKGARGRWDRIRSDASSNATSIAKDEAKQCPIPNQLNQLTKPSASETKSGSDPPGEFDRDPSEAVEDWARASTPAHLRSPEFYRAFGTWMLARDRRPSAHSVRLQLLELGKKTKDAAIAACMYSARGGYATICEPKQNGFAGKKASSSKDWKEKAYAPG